MFSKKLNNKLDQYHLLKHPFYKSWNEGKLTREIIKDYAEQYYQHVKAFPRYISATHSLCEDIEKRKILLENSFEGWCTVEQDCDPLLDPNPLSDAKLNREYLEAIGFS